MTPSNELGSLGTGSVSIELLGFKYSLDGACSNNGALGDGEYSADISPGCVWGCSSSEVELLVLNELTAGGKSMSSEAAIGGKCVSLEVGIPSEGLFCCREVFCRLQQTTKNSKE